MLYLFWQGLWLYPLWELVLLSIVRLYGEFPPLLPCFQSRDLHQSGQVVLGKTVSLFYLHLRVCVSYCLTAVIHLGPSSLWLGFICSQYHPDIEDKAEHTCPDSHGTVLKIRSEHGKRSFHHLEFPPSQPKLHNLVSLQDKLTGCWDMPDWAHINSTSIHSGFNVILLKWCEDNVDSTCVCPGG